MDEYIEREAAKKVLAFGVGVTAANALDKIPAADVVEAAPELRKVVELLHNEHEKAKRQEFVYDPLAYAVYQVWKAVDGRRKNGRCRWLKP